MYAAGADVLLHPSFQIIERLKGLPGPAHSSLQLFLGKLRKPGVNSVRGDQFRVRSQQGDGMASLVGVQGDERSGPTRENVSDAADSVDGNQRITGGGHDPLRTTQELFQPWAC